MDDKMNENRLTMKLSYISYLATIPEIAVRPPSNPMALWQ